ncbi:MAG: type II toxin-antitoxin system Phd/YefM family antitoxin [Clostridiales bacterium]|nr:type II toxin-antitoxin system Phd/YefM family antitoxin [Clostridiales bacterium]
MTINSETITSMTEANQNFSRVARIADRHGEAVIFRNNRPKYRLIDLEREPEFALSDDEKIDVAAARILRRYRSAFEELAK